MPDTEQMNTRYEYEFQRCLYSRTQGQKLHF